MLEWTIIIPYRPLSGGLTMGNPPPDGVLRQQADGKWVTVQGDVRNDSNDIAQTIRYINKNSVYKHKILVCIDVDVFPHESFLLQFDNVEVIKSDYVVPQEQNHKHYYREAAAYKAALDHIKDGEQWICYGYNADWIPSNEWDKNIENAISSHGDSFVYAPLFVELRAFYGLHDFTSEVLTEDKSSADKILVGWRKIACHHLIMPVQRQHQIVNEKDLQRFVSVVKRGNLQDEIELCGLRLHGYYNALVMKAKYAKQTEVRLNAGYDIEFEGRLGLELGLNKVVVANAFVFHPYHAVFVGEQS